MDGYEIYYAIITGVLVAGLVLMVISVIKAPKGKETKKGFKFDNIKGNEIQD